MRINYQSIGSGGGIRQFTEGTVDFGATDGPMNDQQIAAAGSNVLHVPTVLGAVVVTYNLPEVGQTPSAVRRADPGRRLPRPHHQVERQPASRRSTPASSSRPRTSSWSTGRTARARRSSSPTSCPRSRPTWKQKVGKRHLGELADRAGRQGQRGRDPAGEAVRGRHRLRRAHLRDLEQAALRRSQERRGRSSSSRRSRA